MGIWWSRETKVVRTGLLADRFPDAEYSFKSKLQSAVQRLAAGNMFIGTSSWKYPGWTGQIYDEQRYCYRGKFAESRFERDCLVEYAEVFKTVCVDAAYYQFPSEKYLTGLVEKVPADFRFTFKVTDDITLKRFTNLPRFGIKAGQPNNNFLNADLFVNAFLRPTMSLQFLPVLDSAALAEARRAELDLDRGFAAELGRSAVGISEQGWYENTQGERVELRQMVTQALARRRSLPPGAALPEGAASSRPLTRVQVTNETTLGAARRLGKAGCRTLALNFANGVHPGGGFRHGARAQEECLCRSSALFLTLRGDAMYDAHLQRPTPDSTDWCILSPEVPVFRRDNGAVCARPWLGNSLTCAAPVASRVGQPLAGDLLQRRIHRVLQVARAFGYDGLVLGAWGCGAFGGEPGRTAQDFRTALAGEFDGAFAEVVFAIADWSPERRFLGPFARVFSPAAA